MTIKQLFKKTCPQEIELNKQPYVLLPLDIWYELEDMMLMANPKIQKELVEAEKEIKEGKFITLEDYHKQRKTKND